jgi:hypothetical protein
MKNKNLKDYSLAKNALISFIAGIIGFLLLISGSSMNYLLCPEILASFGHFLRELSGVNIFFGYIGTFLYFSFIFVFFLSIFGIFCGIKSYNRILAILAIILNSINLLLSLFIAWALFGLARGM